MTDAILKPRIEARVSLGLLGQWYVVAKSVEVRPSRPHRVRALGRDLVVWRGEDGGVRCLEDRCPHRGAPLSRGYLVGANIACGYHGVTVDGNGVIVSVPALGDCPLTGRAAVACYQVAEASDAIFVYIPSIASPHGPALELPPELTAADHASFLCTAPWACNYRYVMDNLVDPMHGIYLHGDTFTLAQGLTQDKVAVDPTEHGFIVRRVGQQGVNFDWMEMVARPEIIYGRVLIPYPPAGGPGGPMTVIAFVTPIDEHHCRIFFWRTRRVSGLEREVWRFMYRATFEARHWRVLEQDREMMMALPDDAREHEMLYQHDMGVTRFRKLLADRAAAQIRAENAAADSSAG